MLRLHLVRLINHSDWESECLVLPHMGWKLAPVL